MNILVSQITGNWTVCSIVSSGWWQRIIKDTFQWPSVREIHRSPLMIKGQKCEKRLHVMTSSWTSLCNMLVGHDDVIQWKHFPRYWPFVRGIDRSPVNSPYKGQWCGALMFSLIEYCCILFIINKPNILEPSNWSMAGLCHNLRWNVGNL